MDGLGLYVNDGGGDGGEKGYDCSSDCNSDCSCSYDGIYASFGGVDVHNSILSHSRSCAIRCKRQSGCGACACAAFL